MGYIYANDNTSMSGLSSLSTSLDTFPEASAAVSLQGKLQMNGNCMSQTQHSARYPGASYYDFLRLADGQSYMVVKAKDNTLWAQINQPGGEILYCQLVQPGAGASSGTNAVTNTGATTTKPCEGDCYETTEMETFWLSTQPATQGIEIPVKKITEECIPEESDPVYDPDCEEILAALAAMGYPIQGSGLTGLNGLSNCAKLKQMMNGVANNRQRQINGLMGLSGSCRRINGVRGLASDDAGGETDITNVNLRDLVAEMCPQYADVAASMTEAQLLQLQQDIIAINGSVDFSLLTKEQWCKVMEKYAPKKAGINNWYIAGGAAVAAWLIFK